MSQQKYTGEQKSVASLNKEDELLRLTQWVKDHLPDKPDDLRPMDTGCHCGEGCGAWYNLD